MNLYTSLHGLYGEVGAVFLGFRDGDDVCRGGVMMMEHVCFLDEALLGVVCVSAILYVPLSGCDGFCPVLHN